MRYIRCVFPVLLLAPREELRFFLYAFPTEQDVRVGKLVPFSLGSGDGARASDDRFLYRFARTFLAGSFPWKSRFSTLMLIIAIPKPL